MDSGQTVLNVRIDGPTAGDAPSDRFPVLGERGGAGDERTHKGKEQGIGGGKGMVA